MMKHVNLSKERLQIRFSRFLTVSNIFLFAITSMLLLSIFGRENNYHDGFAVVSGLFF